MITLAPTWRTREASPLSAACMSMALSPPPHRSVLTLPPILQIKELTKVLQAVLDAKRVLTWAMNVSVFYLDVGMASRHTDIELLPI